MTAEPLAVVSQVPFSHDMDTRARAWQAISLCQQNQWEKGLEGLLAIAQEEPLDLPGRYYSYLGFGIARYQGKIKDGIKLCRRAVELEFFQVENYLNLAKTYALARNRARAMAAIEEGLRLDPGHQELLTLSRVVDQRRRPLFGFLPRRHPINRTVGRLRHLLARFVGA
jgi:tetratricopeptide (TPR) repeat protein